VPPPPALPQPGTATPYSPGFGEAQKVWLAQVNNPWRKLGVVAAYGFFFFRFTDLHLIIAAKTGFPNYLLYFFAVPALVGVVASGGVNRAFRLKSGRYFLAFLGMMTGAALASSWLGGSLMFTFSYFRATWICFVLLAGLLMTWQELWRMLQLIAVCAAVNVLIATFMSKFFEESGRAGVEIGTNSNPNDFAAVLILVLPFLGLVVCTPKANIAARVLALVFLPWGLYHILASGSRGAMVGIVVATIYLIMKLPHRLKAPAVLGCLLICAMLIPAMPKGIIERLTSWNGGTDKSAVESMQARKLLLQRSLRYTVQHPLLGVGPQQFPNYEGKRDAEARNVLWYGTHNSYTQISSECGIPAVIFYLLALTYSYGLLRRVYQRTRRRKPSPNLKKLRRAALCTLVSMVGFCVTIAFNNFGYMFFTPALIGLAAVFTEVTEHQFHIPVRLSYRTHSKRGWWTAASVEPVA
jgi:hypothetical protein